MIDVTDATFETEVLERSDAVAVVIDLWAPWCGPCRTLGPIIERVVDATDGKVLLVKVNVDENPAISQAFQVQSIPAVYAIKDRKVIDGFVGAQAEPQVREFVQRLLPSEEDLAVARLIEAGDEASLREALEQDPDNEAAILALARLLIDADQSEEALLLLARIPETAETRAVAALARTEGLVDEDIELTLIELLERVKDDDDARQEYVDLLERLGPDDPRTAGYRKMLTAKLY